MNNLLTINIIGGKNENIFVRAFAAIYLFKIFITYITINLYMYV